MLGRHFIGECIKDLKWDPSGLRRYSTPVSQVLARVGTGPVTPLLVQLTVSSAAKLFLRRVGTSDLFDIFSDDGPLRQCLVMCSIYGNTVRVGWATGSGGAFEIYVTAVAASTSPVLEMVPTARTAKYVFMHLADVQARAQHSVLMARWRNVRQVGTELSRDRIWIIPGQNAYSRFKFKAKSYVIRERKDVIERALTDNSMQFLSDAVGSWRSLITRHWTTQLKRYRQSVLYAYPDTAIDLHMLACEGITQGTVKSNMWSSLLSRRVLDALFHQFYTNNDSDELPFILNDPIGATTTAWYQDVWFFPRRPYTVSISSITKDRANLRSQHRALQCTLSESAPRCPVQSPDPDAQDFGSGEVISISQLQSLVQGRSYDIVCQNAITLGRGKQATVYLGRLSGNTDVAVRELPSDSPVCSIHSAQLMRCSPEVADTLASVRLSTAFTSGASPHFVRVFDAFYNEDKKKYYQVLERVHGSLDKFPEFYTAIQMQCTGPKPCFNELLDNVITQAVFAVYQMQKWFQASHNDLHMGNIMLQLCTSYFNGARMSTTESFVYTIDGNVYSVPNLGAVVKIGDFGHSVVRQAGSFDVALKGPATFQWNGQITMSNVPDDGLVSNVVSTVVDKVAASGMEQASGVSTVNTLRRYPDLFDDRMDISVLLNHLNLSQFAIGSNVLADIRSLMLDRDPGVGIAHCTQDSFVDWVLKTADKNLTELLWKLGAVPSPYDIITSTNSFQKLIVPTGL